MNVRTKVAIEKLDQGHTLRIRTGDNGQVYLAQIKADCYRVSSMPAKGVRYLGQSALGTLLDWLLPDAD